MLDKTILSGRRLIAAILVRHHVFPKKIRRHLKLEVISFHLRPHMPQNTLTNFG